MILIKKWKQKEPKMEYFEWDNIREKIACVHGIEDINKFLRPTYEDTHPYYLLPNVDKAVDKITEALLKGKMITVFADPDNDGICSFAIMYRYLKNITDKVEMMFIQRNDGHGLEKGINVIPKGTELLIAVDSSTNDTEQCKLISEKGIDIIIIDHHLPEKDNPYAIIVNNQYESYPNKYLSGAGVVYKVCQALDDKFRVDYADNYLDLVSVGLLGDVMSMYELENRYYVNQGLRHIKNLGLKTLLKITKSFDIDSSTIGWKIAPLINAATRMSKIELVLQLLISDNEEECLVLAKEIAGLNEKRKTLQSDTIDKIKDKIKEDEKVIIVIANGEIDKGMNGLVAQEVASKFKRPALVVRLKDGICSGSARTYDGFNLKTFLESSDLFVFCHGHSGSFGVEFEHEKLEQIKEYIKNNIEENVFTDEIVYDLEIEAEELTDEFVKVIKEFNYITGGDYQPIKLLVKNIPINTRKVKGNNKDTVGFESNNFELIKFKVDKDWGEEFVDNKIDVIGEVGINKWWHNGKKQWIMNSQIRIDDYQIR